jgi:methylmalonyl-CoA mutase N-terminal domain/subunit
MFIQNDVLKEYVARGTQIFPAEAGLKLSVDVIEHIATKIPKWVSLAMSGYHIREAGSNAVQEVAFTFANAREYLDKAIARGVSVDFVAPTLFTFLSSNIDFLPEIAKFRAARRVWAKLMREKYGAKDPASEKLRIFAFTAGSSLTAQQAMNNVVRTSIEMMSAALGGIQTMHVSAFDEALGVPSEEAATLALRTQQVIAFETGVLDSPDPLAGSYELERMTDELEREIWELLAGIEKRGGALECINNGYFVNEISENSYKLTMAIESGARKVVGVNAFQSESAPIKPFEINPKSESEQVASVKAVRAKRDNKAVTQALENLLKVAKAGDNVVPATVEAIKAYATVGEIVNELRKVYGKWQPTKIF